MVRFCVLWVECVGVVGECVGSMFRCVSPFTVHKMMIIGFILMIVMVFIRNKLDDYSL